MNAKVRKIACNLSFQIFLAMIFGSIVGLVINNSIAKGTMQPQAAEMFTPLGDIFVKLLMMLVIPLVSVSIISGAAALGSTKSAGKMGIRAVSYYLFSTIVAVVLGIVMGNIFKPGAGFSQETVRSIASSYTQPIPAAQQQSLWDVVKSFVPENPIQAFASAQIIQVLFFCLLVGLGISTLPKEKREFLTKWFDSMMDALIWVVMVTMRTAPVGVFALIVTTVATCGSVIFTKLLMLLLVCTLAMLIHIYGFFSLSLLLFSKMPLRRFWGKILRPQIFAFTTASTLATLPVTFETCEKELGVSKETCSFVLPLGGATFKNGNANYFAIAAVFFSQIYGIPLGLPQYFAIIVTATLGAIGSVGTPGPSLLLVAVLASAGLPLEGIGMLYAVDRIFDMMRTVMNVTVDAVCAVIADGSIKPDPQV